MEPLLKIILRLEIPKYNYFKSISSHYHVKQSVKNYFIPQKRNILSVVSYYNVKYLYLYLYCGVNKTEKKYYYIEKEIFYLLSLIIMSNITFCCGVKMTEKNYYYIGKKKYFIL